MKLNKTFLIWLIFYILVFSFLLYYSYSYLDNDLGWHLLVGRQITLEKTAPNYEYYNYTLAGTAWVDHEWLFNFLVFNLYHYAGYLAVSVFFALLVIITLLLLNWFIKKYFWPANNNFLLIAVFELFGVLAMAPHLGVRLQEIALLFLVLLLIILEKYRREKNWRSLVWLPFLFFVWANLHGSFLVGLAGLGLWLFIGSAEIIAKKYQIFYWLDLDHAPGWKNILTFAGFSFLSFLATLATPYGLKLYGFLADFTDKFYQTWILEWMPFYYLPIGYNKLIYSAVISAALILLAYFALTKTKDEQDQKNFYRIDLFYASLIIVFLYLSFKSKRHFPLFFIVSLPFAVAFYSRLLITKSRSVIASFFTGRSATDLFVFAYLGIAVLFLVANFLLRIDFAGDPFTSERNCRSFPCAAVTFMKQEAYRDRKILNDYSWGGYLLGVWPEKKLFIDGRLPEKKFAGHTLLEEYSLFFDPPTIREKLDQYGIEMTLIKKAIYHKVSWMEKNFLGLKQADADKLKNNLADFLNSDSGWRCVFDDDISQVYVKSEIMN